MPRVPQYQPGQIGPVQTTGERFRAPEGPGAAGILAEGLAGVSRLASTQDKINAENDETQARLAIAQARGQYAGAVDQYKGTKLGAARAGQPDFDKGLDGIRDSVMKTATSPRMRQMIELGLAEVDSTARRMGASHAFTQSQDETRASFGIEQTALIDTAASSDDPASRDRTGLQLRDSVRRQLAFDGYDEAAMPQAYAVAEQAAMTKMHGGVVDRLFAAPDPDIDEVGQYLSAYRDEMTSDLYTKTLERMQGPLQERVDDYRADLIQVVPTMGDGPAGAAPGPWQGVAVSVAKRFGLDPTDVAAVMSYETGGTFSPSIMGGKNGQYMGLIQFGPAERKKYGIDKSSSPETWTKAVGDFLEDRGFKSGMGVMDLYSTINAGTPGRYNASDGNGTVRTHVAEILGAHKEKAKGWLGGAGIYDNAPRQWDKAAVFDTIEKKAVDEGWTPEATKRVKNVWTKRMSTDEGLLSEQRRAADESATTVLASAGDGFRTSMIPRATWSALAPAQQIQFQNIEKKLLEPKEVKAHGDTALGIKLMSNGNPQDVAKFAAFNLAKARPYMTPGEYEELATAQVKAQQGLRNPKALEVRNKIDSAITRSKKWEGVDADKNADEGFRIRRYMEERATAEAGKRDLGDADYDRLFRDATKAVRVTGMFGMSSSDTKRSSEVLSPNYRGMITRSFQRANGRAPTEAEVQTAWEAMGAPGS